MVTGGDDTVVHGITAPEEYDNFATEYYDLLEKVDQGLVVIVDSTDSTAPSLSDFESGSHTNVLAFDIGEEQFHVSENGTFGDPISMSVDFTELTETQVDELAAQLEENFLRLDGSTPMQGDLDMDGNNINNAGELKPDTLILPTK